ncbi:MAG: hypothetical protein EPO28_13870 [Saprospiraceae bacterium]|nr:MAG: hypothetical protein EPO28_13870 [Saprospiraceae bacterium]
MRVYFDTNGDIVTSPAARMWFYQMRDNLVERGIEADLNQLGQTPYDIAVIHWARPDAIQRIVEHSPNAHIGIMNPGYLGLDLTSYRKAVDKDLSNNKILFFLGKTWARTRSLFLTSPKIDQVDYILDNTDFFIVTGFVWRDILLPFKKRVYLTIDYDTPVGKPLKQHTRISSLVIGYHGNPFHFKEDFFPNGANAIRRLAREYDFTLRIITRNAMDQPSIEGIHTEYIEFELSTFDNEIQKFDIGICPVLADYTQFADPLKLIRNPNRVNTLLFYGIPSVTSPTPQSCQDLCDGETALFAVTEEGWYQALRALITQPELRNTIGRKGREMVEHCFSRTVATDLFVQMLNEEIRYPK